MASNSSDTALRRGPASWPGIVGLLLLAVATAAMLGLHRARPDLDMVATPLSFYSRGAQAWLLALSLITSGLAVLVITASLGRRAKAKTGIAALAITGVGMVLAAIFVADPWFPWEKNLTTVGWVHASVAGLSVVAFAVGALLVSRDVALVDDDRLMRRVLWTLAVAFVAVLGFFGGMTLVFLGFGRPPGFLGLAERLLMTLAVTWLVMVAPVPGRLVGGGSDLQRR